MSRVPGGLLALVRVTHPLPSTLVAATTAGLAVIAGADPDRAALVGLAMLALQASIGADNDLHDAVSDARIKPTKPIPAGDLARPAAQAVAAGGLCLGTVLTAALSLVALPIAVAGVACGFVHTRWTRGSPLDLVVFGAGISLVPVYAWLASTSTLPPIIAVGVLLAGIAGAGLGLANSLADLERDRGRGVASLAGRLGVANSRRISIGLLLVAIGGALATLVAVGAYGPALWLVAIGAALALVGLGLIRWPARRTELGWEVGAAGIGLLAIGWFAAAGGAC